MKKPRHSLPILEERENVHGDFFHNGITAQRIKAALAGGSGTTMWGAMPAHYREALDLISTKMSRIVTGDHNHADHWVDIAGYATLIADYIKKDKPK